jgi:exosortase
MSEAFPMTPASRGLVDEFRVEFADAWRRLPNKGLFFTLLVVWLGLFHFLGNPALSYLPTPSLFRWLYGVYESGNREDEHGLLVPVVVAILFWLKRKQFDGMRTELWPVGLLFLAAAAGLHVFGYFVQQTRISVLAMLIGVYALMATVWGPGMFRKSFFPFWLLVFCIPMSVIMGPLSLFLRLIATNVVVFITNWVLGMNVLREGTILFSPDHRYDYDVAAACGGLRSLVATFCIATIYAWLVLKTFGRRMVVLASAFPLAVAGNVIRLLMVVLASEFISQRFGMKLHNSEIFSLVPYIPAFIGLFCLGRWLERTEAMTQAGGVADK